MNGTEQPKRGQVRSAELVRCPQSMLWRKSMFLRARIIVVTKLLPLLLFIIVFSACNKPDKPSFGVFASPENAGAAVVEAAKSGDQNALVGIFGADSKEIISSGDVTQDKTMTNKFVEAYGVMHRWRKMPDGTQVLLIGADNFAFPIPL